MSTSGVCGVYFVCVTKTQQTPDKEEQLISVGCLQKSRKTFSPTCRYMQDHKGTEGQRPWKRAEETRFRAPDYRIIYGFRLLFLNRLLKGLSSKNFAISSAIYCLAQFWGRVL